MTVLVLILILAPLIIFILTAPVNLTIDTKKENYGIRLGKLISLRGNPSLENPEVGLRIGFWNKKWGFAQLRNRTKLRAENNENANSGKRPQKKNTHNWKLKRYFRILQAFKINKCCVDVDTDDYILNAQLIPLFHYFNSMKGQWRINFKGDVSVQFDAESNLVRMLYAIWRRK